jgi:hypothetical protein
MTTFEAPKIRISVATLNEVTSWLKANNKPQGFAKGLEDYLLYLKTVKEKCHDAAKESH